MMGHVLLTCFILFIGCCVFVALQYALKQLKLSKAMIRVTAITLSLLTCVTVILLI